MFEVIESKGDAFFSRRSPWSPPLSPTRLNPYPIHSSLGMGGVGSTCVCSDGWWHSQCLGKGPADLLYHNGSMPCKGWWTHCPINIFQISIQTSVSIVPFTKWGIRFTASKFTLVVFERYWHTLFTVWDILGNHGGTCKACRPTRDGGG
jgi:hypothetical protein